MKLSDLNPNPKNPRKITDKKLTMLKKSLAKFGDLSGIVFNKQTGHIVGGHQRLKALPKDALIVMDTETYGHVMIDGDRFQYRIVDWDETTEKAANIAANQHGGDFDIPILNEWLLDLDAANFDMDLTGFDSDELENLIVPVTIEGLCDPDEVPDVKEEPIAKRGDVWQLGNHRLMCGDSTSIDDVEKLMNGQKVDMVFTDPPYNQYIGDSSTGLAQRPGFQKLLNSGLNDFNPEEFFSILSTLTVPTVYAFCSKDLLSKYINYWNSEGRSWDLLVMNKANPTPMKNNKFLGDIEWLFFSRGDGATFNGGEPYECYYKCRSVNCRPSDFGHPTEKQVSFIEPYLKISSPQSGKVLDLFGGAGSTLIACEKMNRKCFMMELDPRYCDVIIARWERFTGKKASLLTQSEQGCVNEQKTTA